LVCRRQVRDMAVHGFADGTMAGVTTTGVPGTSTEPPRTRIDRPVLVGNLVSGALWLLPLAFASWPLSLMGAAYVATGSVFLAAVYARDALTRRQEALAWTAPWLAAVALWVWIGASIEGGNTGSDWPLVLLLGVGIGTPCYLAWQLSALAVRQLLVGCTGTGFSQGLRR
jgi:hypothetical protein